MRPEWFCIPPSSESSESGIPMIPYDGMWEGDRHWMPFLLPEDGPFFVGREDFEIVDGKERLRRWWFGEQRGDVKSDVNSIRSE